MDVCKSMHDFNRLKDKEKKLLERFIRYAKVETTSLAYSQSSPSTKYQWDLLKILKQELFEIGAEDVTLDENGYIIARIPPSPGYENITTIGFLAHIDTASDVSGKNVNPVIHENYNGETIKLNGTEIAPSKYPDLKKYKGETIITSDGNTLLGADDKAGVAEIMTAAEYMISHKEMNHGPIEIFFTPDEEIGRGMSKFPVEKVKSLFCYTLDGDGEGTIEMECFNAYSATVKIKGNVIHLGNARGKLINAVKLASEFVQMLPSQESPEATDERYGYYCANGISGNLGEAKVELLLRDFDKTNMEKRIKAVESAAKTLELLYPGSLIDVSFKRQYGNMADYIGKESLGIKLLFDAVKKCGIEPVEKIIRGGTDGARLSEMGIPCPNIFTGGYNYHSREEWAALCSMVKASNVIITLVELWANSGK
ncbi:MAG: peptidase T [Spirochaetaceae bacterium]|nr:peptidase T [Spirochaetaceae bacterium]